MSCKKAAGPEDEKRNQWKTNSLQRYMQTKSAPPTDWTKSSGIVKNINIFLSYCIEWKPVNNRTNTFWQKITTKEQSYPIKQICFAAGHHG